MTDDIVTRLREHAAEGIWDFTKCSWDIQDAADEIERLREENEALKTGYLVIQKDRQRLYALAEQAVRGDV